MPSTFVQPPTRARAIIVAQEQMVLTARVKILIENLRLNAAGSSQISVRISVQNSCCPQTLPRTSRVDPQRDGLPVASALHCRATCCGGYLAKMVLQSLGTCRRGNQDSRFAS